MTHRDRAGDPRSLAQPPRPGAPAGRAAGTGFRHHLRLATQPQHEQAERAFAPFSAAPVAELDGFLRLQWGAFSALLAHRGAGGEPRAAALLERLVSTLALDCTGERAARLPARRDPMPLLDPRAVDYIVTGSRLGTEVLRRALLGAGAVRMPQYFLPDPEAAPLWQAVCATLEAVPCDTPDARRIVAHVRHGYRLFLGAPRSE